MLRVMSSSSGKYVLPVTVRAISSESMVRKTTKILPEDLLDLINNRISFVRVPGYCSPEISGEICDRLKHSYNSVDYENAPGVGRVEEIGMAFFEATSSCSKLEKYYMESADSMRKGRELFTPYLSPLDKLRLELDSEWQAGASLLNLGQGKMFSGLVRVLSEEILAHEDKLERDLSCSKEELNYVAQIAANIYLQMPNKGGSLRAWSRSLDDAEYKELSGESYGIKPEVLGPADVTVHPEVGELVLFNPRNLHSVTKSSGERITQSTFICFQGKDKPLGFWS